MTARRRPRQERSQQTVDRIVAAGVRVLAQHGYQHASTNRIATEAGVSPGSIYQYFADKDAIVAEITRRLVDEFAAALTPALRRAASRPRGEATRVVIEAVLDALGQHADLLRAIVDRIPQAEQVATLQDVRTRLSDAIFNLFLIQGIDADEDALTRATWMIVEVSEHLTIRYVLDAPAIAREDFVADLERVIEGLTPTPR